MGIPEDKISMILGPSGTGKSVCIKHMVGLLYPDEGDIVVHGESVPMMRDEELSTCARSSASCSRTARCSARCRFSTTSPSRCASTPTCPRQRSPSASNGASPTSASPTRRTAAVELSGGMRKRAGFARALVMEPDIVIFDEPDSGLDPVRTALLCELIQEIHGICKGTYIVVTHDIASARRIGEYIALLWRGRIVEAGDAERMFSSDNPFVRQFLSGSAEGPLGME